MRELHPVHEGHQSGADGAALSLQNVFSSVSSKRAGTNREDP
jgi:hypothetical protein